MSKLQINLPEDAKTRLEARAAGGGFASIEQYAEALLLASADLPEGDGLEQLLSARVEDDRPGIEFTSQFAQAFREQVQQRRRCEGEQQ